MKLASLLALSICHINFIAGVRVRPTSKIPQLVAVQATRNIGKVTKAFEPAIRLPENKIDAGRNNSTEESITKNNITAYKISSRSDIGASNGRNVNEIRAKFYRGNSVVISENHTYIAEKAKIDDYATIEDHCYIGCRSKIGKYAKINSRVMIGEHVGIADHCIVNTECDISSYVELLTPNTTIGEGCILRENAKVYSSIGDRVYIGSDATIGLNAQIGKDAIINARTSIPVRGKVFQNDVIIQTPSSHHLYRDCLAFKKLSNSEIATADKGTSEEFHELMNLLIRSVIDEFNLKYNRPKKFEEKKERMKMVGLIRNCLKRIKSLYLIRIHGIDRFKLNNNAISPWMLDPSMSSLSPTLKRANEELHFKAEDDRIREDLKEKIKGLLAMGDSNKSVDAKFVRDGKYFEIFHEIFNEKTRIVKLSSETI